MSGTATGPRPSPGKGYALVAHPDFPSNAATSVSVQIHARPNSADNALWMEFHVRLHQPLTLPAASAAGRADELWRTTCFETFIMCGSGPGYLEFNLSPSFQWAAYAFGGYRSDRSDLMVPFAPEIEITPNASDFWLAADIGMSDVGAKAAIGLSAVIEATDGTKSYWALAHPPGPPDFHNRECFIATLPKRNRP
jgi:hypothetical protein